MDLKMKTRYFILIPLALALLTLPSCKKEKDKDEFSEFMKGELALEPIFRFLNPGDVITAIPYGITTPENVGYYWYNDWNKQKDTTRLEGGTGDGAYTIQVPDEIGEYTLTGIAFAEGYYTSSVKFKFSVVDNSLNGTLKDTDIEKDSDKFVDPRDGMEYYCTKEGDLVWTKNNLAWNGSGRSYESSPVMDKMVGRYYTWKEAQDACPKGWRLPTDEEFVNLVSDYAEGDFIVHEALVEAAGPLMVNAKLSGERMWTYWPEVGITNASGFCAIPAGYCLDMEGSLKFNGFETYATFWTADDEGEIGFYRYIHVKSNDVYIGKGDKESFCASVRCVKER